MEGSRFCRFDLSTFFGVCSNGLPTLDVCSCVSLLIAIFCEAVAFKWPASHCNSKVSVTLEAVSAAGAGEALAIARVDDKTTITLATR